mmetsp:Transcript_19287/g.76805  ORF Transcript_19287/g.76805 Transcript_19287/m.76805 type:complete len:93 (-) Transcript_19287:31-309(-)
MTYVYVEYLRRLPHCQLSKPAKTNSPGCFGVTQCTRDAVSQRYTDILSLSLLCHPSISAQQQHHCHQCGGHVGLEPLALTDTTSSKVIAPLT